MREHRQRVAVDDERCVELGHDALEQVLRPARISQAATDEARVPGVRFETRRFGLFENRLRSTDRQHVAQHVVGAQHGHETRARALRRARGEDAGARHPRAPAREHDAAGDTLVRVDRQIGRQRRSPRGHVGVFPGV